MPDKLLTIEEVADKLSISPGTIRSLEFRKRVGLSAVRIGRTIRFTRQEIENFINRHTEIPPAGGCPGSV